MNGVPKIHTGALVIASAIMFHAAIQATAMAVYSTVGVVMCVIAWLGFVASVAFSAIACMTGEVVTGTSSAPPSRRSDGM